MWIASAGYTFATTGAYATPLLTGFAGAESHVYDSMPLFQIVAGFLLSAFGLSLPVLRAASLLFAAAGLAAVWRLGRRLLSPRAGLLALLVLAFVPVEAPTLERASGIPFADLGRLARYDVAVPVFGLVAFLALVPALGEPRPAARRLVGAGLLAGFATLAHAYGAAWLAALAAALLGSGSRGRALARSAALLVAGFVLPLLPWAAFAAGHLADFALQNRLASERTDFASLSFYGENLASEWHRYRPFLDALRGARPGAWLLAVGAAAGAILVARANRRAGEKPRSLLFATGAVVLLFALFLRPRYAGYLATVWPLLALLAAFALDAAFGARRLLVRGTAAVALLAALAEGAAGRGRIAKVASETPPYAEVGRALAAAVPKGARLLAFHHYWMALEGHVASYRSVLVPIYLTDPRYADLGFTFTSAADLGEPDVFILDPHLLGLLDRARDPSDPLHRLVRDVPDYLASRSARRTAAFTLPAYGRFEVYSLAPKRLAR